jgi:hypothetical protein
LIDRVAQIATAMHDADNIDLFVADEPIDNPVVLKNHLADIVAFGLRYEAATQWKLLQPIHTGHELLDKALRINRGIAADILVDAIERIDGGVGPVNAHG